MRMQSGPNGVTTTRYVYGLGLIGEDTAGVYTTYHFDARGSTVALTDISANVTDTFCYGPYGELNNHTGSSTTPFQYNGQFGVQTDPNGLLYMRARYYNPAIRRFINQDVLFGNINPGISLNRFAYANGNPVSLMDPFGLCAEEGQTDAFGNPTTLQGWQQSWDNLAAGINAVKAWEQQANNWLYQQMPWLTYVTYGLNVANRTAQYSLMFVPAAGLALDALAGMEGAAAAAESTTTALQPMADAAFQTGTIRNIAGYEVAGNAGLVGNTYNVNLWGLYATENSQGPFALVNALNSEASAAGATQISITGNAVVNQSLLNISPGVAGRLGFQFQQINPTTILLQGAVH
jgi:RHS repeat-associated protein